MNTSVKLYFYLFSMLFSKTCTRRKVLQNITAQTMTPFSAPRKEVIQPHLPIRLPCYDFTPITNPAFGCWILPVSSQTSGVACSRGVTGGVYKTRERIHRGMLIRDY